MNRVSSTVLLVVLLAVAAESRVIYNRFGSEPPHKTPPQLADGGYGYEIIRNTMKRNRQCLLNAGLSAGCDLSDLLQAQTQARKFMSFAGPGK
uniref:Uncharacterized protein n=1 Tax=Caenorhabditis japonica TaxID=281687 RepID=A0A8R1E3V1_CAEJA